MKARRMDSGIQREKRKKKEKKVPGALCVLSGDRITYLVPGWIISHSQQQVILHVHAGHAEAPTARQQGRYPVILHMQQLLLRLTSM